MNKAWVLKASRFFISVGIIVAAVTQYCVYADAQEVIETSDVVAKTSVSSDVAIDVSGFEVINSRSLVSQSYDCPNVQIDSSFSGVESTLAKNAEAYKEQQRQARIRSEVASRGSMGRLYAPSIGIDVALFNSMSQAVCDAPDSACYFYIGGAPVIGDHQNQGFSRIRSAVPGSTLMYISDGTNITTYRCVASYNGYNTGYNLTDEAGVSATGKYPGSIILYTCRQDWQHITIVHISPVG